jgi:hypothetical protein
MQHTAHSARVADLLTRLDEATERFTARLERAGARAEQAETGWTPAQIAAHVSLVNDNFASVIDGTAAVAAPPPEGFSERAWSDVASAIPSRFDAPTRFVPPGRVTAAQAMAMVRDSAARLRAAIAALTPERGPHCFTNRIVGTINLYQTGEWAIAHIARHNQQAKRQLGE